jgi:hypothetical protein
MSAGERRALHSMRARMTLGFVLVVAPCLLIISTFLPGLATGAVERRTRQRVVWLVRQVRAATIQPDWRARLTEVIEPQLLRESHLALLIVDENGSLAWRSPGPGPVWPLRRNVDWGRELRGRAEVAEASSREEAARLRERRNRRPSRPSRLEAERPGSETEAAAPAERAPAVARETPRRSVGLRERRDDWEVAEMFRVGTERQPLMLVAAQDVRAIERERTVQRRGMLLLSLCAVLGVAGGTWALVWRTLSPIRRLALQASAASAELRHAGNRQVANLEVRLQAPSADAEVVELVETLNGLLSRLAETAAVKPTVGPRGASTRRPRTSCAPPGADRRPAGACRSPGGRSQPRPDGGRV